VPPEDNCLGETPEVWQGEPVGFGGWDQNFARGFALLSKETRFYGKDEKGKDVEITFYKRYGGREDAEYSSDESNLGSRSAEERRKRKGKEKEEKEGEEVKKRNGKGKEKEGEEGEEKQDGEEREGEGEFGLDETIRDTAHGGC
jgi:hypothetical protein